MSGATFTCPVCGRGGWLLRTSLLEHLTGDHTPVKVADELVRATTAAPGRPVPPPCGKRRYPTEHAAAAELVSAWAEGAKGNPFRREIRTYFCEPCHAWHLTSNPGRTDT